MFRCVLNPINRCRLARVGFLRPKLRRREMSDDAKSRGLLRRMLPSAGERGRMRGMFGQTFFGVASCALVVATAVAWSYTVGFYKRISDADQLQEDKFPYLALKEYRSAARSSNNAIPAMEALAKQLGKKKNVVFVTNTIVNKQKKKREIKNI
jgi:hypothetical protein